MKLFRKKEVWRLTVPGLILILLVCGVLAFTLFFKLYPFLATTRPLPQAELAIIEGWLADAEIEEVVQQIRPDQIVVTSGGPIEKGQAVLQYDNYAELAAIQLIQQGVESERILIAPAPETRHDRTFISALAVRRRLEEEGLFGKSIDLYSTGAHARRSHLLYKRVFGRTYALGVIAIAPSHYDLDHWYLHSQGVRHVTGELVAWIYAKFLMLRHT